MIINYPHVKIINDNGKINRARKRCNPIYKVKCDNCGKEFEEKQDTFDNRISKINSEYCGKCAMPLMASLAGLKGNYNEDGTLKENSGRFSSKKWNSLSQEDLEKRTTHNKNIALQFHEHLRKNPDKKEEFYNKIYKSSKIGYISKVQEEIFNLIKDYGYELDGMVSGMRVDIVNKEKKIAIEYNGDFWHCNPLFWEADDFNKVLKMTAQEKWTNDRNRRIALRRNGYIVHVIWENDWNTDRNKVFSLLKEITDDNYTFEPWIYVKKGPLKGKTYEDIYGEEKAKILKKNMSDSRVGKKYSKNVLFKITTLNDGIFYVKNLTEWRRLVKKTYCKLITYKKIDFNDKIKLWDKKPFELNLTITCPKCKETHEYSANLERYHFNNCKKYKNK